MNRRDLLKAGAAVLAAAPSFAQTPRVERWDVFELALNGPKEGNPFLDTWLKATFRKGARSMTVDGFYDGDGVYRIRFMPDSLGEWSYTTASNAPSLHAKAGSFQAI